VDVRDTALHVPPGAMAQPRLTPDAVRAASFRSARLGRRGLDPDDVREFCGRVEDELVMLVRERTALQEEVSRLRHRVLGASDDAGSVTFRDEDAHARAVRILSRAQQTAQRYVADAEEYSRRLAQDARQRREEILAEAARAASAPGPAAAHEAAGPVHAQPATGRLR
jgi:DivIVA domain-containing protein